MNSQQFSAIKEMVNMIDTRLLEPLDLERLANEMGVSKYHFHHLFKAITGKSVMAYVRGRKLSRSIFDLLNTDLKIVDIANNYQFEHEQSYIRAFRQRFGMTPSECRKLKREVPIEQKIDVNHLVNIGQGMAISPSMCILPRFYVQGLRAEIVHDENRLHQTANQLMELYRDAYLPAFEHVIDRDVYIGLVEYTENFAYSNYYTAGTIVSALSKCEPPVAGFTVPMGEYVVFRYVGFHSPFEITYATIESLYGHIDQWIKKTTYIIGDVFHFEKVDLKHCSESYCEMNIYYPIVSAE